MLDVLGLDTLEEATYRQLIALPSASAAELAQALQESAAELATALASLEGKGLVARSTSGTDTFVAPPPSVALGSLMVERQEELRKAGLELNSLVEQYRGAAAERTVTDVIDVVKGPQAVAQRFGQLQRGARREVLALVQAQVAVVTAEENVDEAVAIERGVDYRVVVEREVLQRPGFFADAASSIAVGEQIRVAQTLPLRMLIADRELALLPLAPTAEDSAGGALLVHPSGLLDALLSLYDFVWQSASPLVATGDGARSTADRLDDIDAQVLSLLLAGLTDQAVGGQLGLSLRTVQRRVSQLMDRARVGTRLQLGHEACRRGWV